MGCVLALETGGRLEMGAKPNRTRESLNQREAVSLSMQKRSELRHGTFVDPRYAVPEDSHEKPLVDSSDEQAHAKIPRVNSNPEQGAKRAMGASRMKRGSVPDLKNTIATPLNNFLDTVRHDPNPASMQYSAKKQESRGRNGADAVFVPSGEDVPLPENHATAIDAPFSPSAKAMKNASSSAEPGKLREQKRFGTSFEQSSQGYVPPSPNVDPGTPQDRLRQLLANHVEEYHDGTGGGPSPSGYPTGARIWASSMKRRPSGKTKIITREDAEEYLNREIRLVDRPLNRTRVLGDEHMALTDAVSLAVELGYRPRVSIFEKAAAAPAPAPDPSTPGGSPTTPQGTMTLEQGTPNHTSGVFSALSKDAGASRDPGISKDLGATDLLNGESMAFSIGSANLTSMKQETARSGNFVPQRNTVGPIGGSMREGTASNGASTGRSRGRTMTMTKSLKVALKGTIGGKKVERGKKVGFNPRPKVHTYEKIEDEEDAGEENHAPMMADGRSAPMEVNGHAVGISYMPGIADEDGTGTPFARAPAPGKTQPMSVLQAAAAAASAEAMSAGAYAEEEPAVAVLPTEARPSVPKRGSLMSSASDVGEILEC